MKKLTVLLCSLALVFSVAGVAGATPYEFEDMIDTWGSWNVDAAYIGQNSPLSYQHDIRDDVDFLAGDLVTSATLELDFTNDFTDSHGSFFCLSWDGREFTQAAYDGDTWHIGEVDNGQYDLILNVDWLNDNGLLDVVLSVTNPLGTATAYLDHSRLYGTAESSAPVPEPSTVLLMGVGLLGLVGVGRKKLGKKA